MAAVVKERRETILKALARLHSTLKKIDDEKYSLDFDEMRDSLIQRFEFSMDTFWKFLNAYLQEIKGINFEGPPTPRATFRMLLQFNILSRDDFNKCISMVEDRNRTSHVYDEEIAQEIFEKIPEYYVFMKKLVDFCRE